MYRLDRLRRIAAGSLLLLAIGGSGAQAQQSQPPAPPITAGSFMANPQGLLQQFPAGGLLLSNAVEQLALTDPTTFSTLLALLQNANSEQKSAIGDGLARATKTEVLTNQKLATDWQSKIAAVTDPAFKTAATNAFGDVRLGSVGGGPLGAGGGALNPAPPPTGSNSGTPQNISSPATNTGQFTFGSPSGASGLVSP